MALETTPIKPLRCGRDRAHSPETPGHGPGT